MRVAYIGVWLAIAEGLRRKFTDMAPRDNVAARHLGEIEAREAQHKAIDAMLIRKAGEYGFVTDAEETRLRHVYENRNVFGHPYEQRPTRELIVAAAAEAVGVVLGRETQLREGYLSEQVRRFRVMLAFIDDAYPALEEYAKGVHRRSARDLRVWFLRKLWRALEPLYADQSLDLFHRRGEHFCATFIREEPSVLDGWDAVADIPTFPKTLSNVFAAPDLFAALDQHPGDIVVGLLVEGAATHAKTLGQAYELLQAGDPTDRQHERLSEAVATAPLARLVSAGIPLGAFIPSVIADLRSHNWYVQNPAADAVRQAGAGELADVPDDELRELGRNVAQAAEGTAGDAVRLIETLPASGPWPSAFIEGLIKEAFVHQSGEIRFKDRYLAGVLRAILGVAPGDRGPLIKAVVSDINNGYPRDPPRFVKGVGDICQTIRHVAAGDHLGDLRSIADALEAVDVKPKICRAKGESSAKTSSRLPRRKSHCGTRHTKSTSSTSATTGPSPPLLRATARL